MSTILVHRPRIDEPPNRPEPPFTVRTATADHTDGITEIITSSHLLDGTMRVPFQPTDALIDRVAQRADQRVLVAVAGDLVVGFLLLKSWPDAPRHSHVAEIDLVATRDDWQGRGVARALLTAAIDLAEQWMGVRRLQLIVFTTNSGAIGLYERLGFEIEGTMRAYGFGRGVDTDAHIMARTRPIR